MSDQIEQMRRGTGFIAALDQSGGSTPKALERYGTPSDAYSTEAEMFDLVHAMRVRIMTNQAFARPRILGAILFEGTMQRSVNGIPTSRFLQTEKNILPFLKVDKGLAEEANGVQLMRPFASDLSERLQEARELGVFGTKMRSVIKGNNASGIAAIVDQQFEYATSIISQGLVPIVEPEIDIEAEDKQSCEDALLEHLHRGLDGLSEDSVVVFKLTLPEQSGFYSAFSSHPRVLRVAALSGGYSQTESIDRLRSNEKMIASFSRALTETLRVSQSEAQFTAELDQAIDGIANASAT